MNAPFQARRLSLKTTTHTLKETHGMTYTIRNYGRSVEGLESLAVLRHEDAPKEIGKALDVWNEARVSLKEATDAHRDAEKAAREGITLTRRADRDAEVRSRTVEETNVLNGARRAATAAARSLVEVLEDCRAEIRALGARLALEAHARAVDLAMDLGGERSRFAAVAPRGVALRPDVDRVVEARRRSAVTPRSLSEELDLVDAMGLAEAAGTRLDLVEIVGRGGVQVRTDSRRTTVGRDAARLLTTKRRAAALVGNGSSGWHYLGEEVSA